MKKLFRMIKKTDNYILNNFVKENIDFLSEDDVLFILSKRYLDKEETQKCINKVKDNRNELFKIAFSTNPNTQLADCLIPNEIELKDDDRSEVNSYLLNIIDNIESNKIYEKALLLNNIMHYVSNKEYVIKRFFNKDISNKEKKEIIIEILSLFNSIDDQLASFMSPYIIQSDSFIPFIFRLKNPKSIKLYVLATKDKKLIAKYIFRAKDHDLLEKIFETSNKYLAFCKEVFSEGELYYIKKFIGQDYNFKYVDSHINDVLASTNEKVDIKFY